MYLHFQSLDRISRSQGIRKKGNDYCERFTAMKLNTSLNDLAVKLRIHDRHTMLSYLRSLPIALYAQRLIDFTVEIINFMMLPCLQDIILNMHFVYLSIPNLIILRILLTFLSLIKELALLKD